MADDKMVWVHVKQTSDTEWEIRTEPEGERYHVTVTGPTSAESDYPGKNRHRTPGAVIGDIINAIRGNPTPQNKVEELANQVLDDVLDSPTDAFAPQQGDAFAPQQSKVFPHKNKERKEQ